jgi:hypothetical protein
VPAQQESMARRKLVLYVSANLGIVVDKTSLAHRIAGVKCQYPTLLETLAGDKGILIEVFASPTARLMPSHYVIRVM